MNYPYFKDTGRQSGHWVYTENICLPSDVTTPMQSSCAEGRCLICLARAPLIPKSAGEGKRPDGGRSVPFSGVGTGHI